MDLDLTEKTAIKEALCRHFNLAHSGSSLTVRLKSPPRKWGGNRYYHIFIRNGVRQHRVFGKVSPYSEREYRNLQNLVKNIPKTELRIPRPVALIRLSDGLLLLQEYLDGYSHIFSIWDLSSLAFQRASVIESFGINVLNTIYRLQQRFANTYQALSTADTSGLPNQPQAIGAFRQLDDVLSLRNNIKKRLESKINAIIARGAVIRRGMIHGDLGMRNIMAWRTEISFIDWDFMQEKGFSLLDPCYFAVILEMRSLQMLLSRRSVANIDTFLFNHIKSMEGAVLNVTNRSSIDDGIWFAKCLSLIDTLWWYEKERNNKKLTLLKQRSRQIKYLAYLLDQEALK